MEHTEKTNKDTFHQEEESHLRDYFIIGVTALLLLAYWFGWFTAFMGIDTSLIAALLCGLPIIKEAFLAIIQKGDTKVGLLVSIAIVASIMIGEYFAAAEVALIMTIGELLEHLTIEKSNTSLQKLVAMTPLKARILTDAGETEIDARHVQVGDRLLIKQGEKIPVDGMVTAGQATVDQSMITGESLPAAKLEGDPVYGGTLAQMGHMEIIATKVGEDTALGHIIQMVAQAQESKAPISRIIDRWADWFVPLSITIALAVYLLTGDIVRSVTILIVFCPCAMLLSTPTAVAAAIGAAARQGILIKGGEVLERAGKIDMVVFDKTGTVTEGEPKLKELRCFGPWEYANILALAAGIEKHSEHHLAKAVLTEADKENIMPVPVNRWEYIVGQGVTAQIEERQYLLGNRLLMEAYGVYINETQDTFIALQQEAGGTVVYLATGQELMAVLVIEDPVRPHAGIAVRKLAQVGVAHVALLTGDATAVGKAVGRQVGISAVHGDLLPGGKVERIKAYQAEGKQVAMVGDGINDAPALATADVGIAMGCVGTDVAVEAADVVLLSDDLNRVTEIMHLSRRALRAIRQNIVAANLINLAAIGLAAYGILGPVPAAIIHNAGAILVVLNSARLLRSATVE